MKLRLGGALILIALVAAMWLMRGPQLQEADAASHDHSSHSLAASDARAPTTQNHESEGLILSAKETEPAGGGKCQKKAKVRSVRIAAINVEVTLSRFGDHDPHAFMFALQTDISRVREEEKRNRQARQAGEVVPLSEGLGDDAIQPMVIRVNQGECLRIEMRNALKDGNVGIHLHESQMVVKGGYAATSLNPDSTVKPGESVTYEWMVGPSEREGTHYFHSHGDLRQQTAHGLFGAVIVEPRGSRHLHPSTGKALERGWQAMIVDPKGPDFREAVLFYHEIGDETFRIRARSGEFVPQVDPLTSAYRPASRALNYRSESFLNRLDAQQKQLGFFDESVAYSSYTFGDPATPIFRSYLGDPMKERVLHAGSEVNHVHHVHGGSIRWRKQPGVEDSGFDDGLTKRPELLPKVSERIDSQALGPSETFDVENECGAGGCQQSVGDFLFHCHVAHHYFSGMWGLWRVYNTLQDGAASTDGQRPLMELPDRKGAIRVGVGAKELANKTVDWSGKKLRISDVTAWVKNQLPPQGSPRGYDASVWSWREESGDYFGPAGNQIRLDPITGKLAYPFLGTNFGQRPPFPPGHGPAPYLDPGGGRDPPAPGANGPGSLCPAGTKLKTHMIQAITLPIVLNQKANLVDPAGELYVLAEDEPKVRLDPRARVPLTLRANAGQDCVDLVLRSELEDTEENHKFAKVNLHVHFMQFDIQASDGVIAGFNYEQSVRPFRVEGEALVAPARQSAQELKLASTNRFQPGALIGIGMDSVDTFEVRAVTKVQGNTVFLDEPLSYSHSVGDFVSTEFLRYRWYPDVQFGTAYFHDHVNALASWKHGLFGAIVSEPPDSTYHDPSTGAEISSGPAADVHTANRVSADIAGPFRELVLFIQDDNPITHIGRSSGGSFNLRVEPARPKREGRRLMEDPETPVLRAYLGDPVVLRTLVAGTNEIHTFRLEGHWFRTEPFTTLSPLVDTVRVGISERSDLSVKSAGGPQAIAADYLFYNGRPSKFAEGSWGVLRVLDQERPDLKRLPGKEAVQPQTENVCPKSAPLRTFQVSLKFRDGKKTKMLQLEGSSGKATPVVLHVATGDCIRIVLSNLTDVPTGIKAGLLASDVGIPETAPGAVSEFQFFAHPEIGESVSLITDLDGPSGTTRAGVYGAIVIGGLKDKVPRSGWNVTARHPDGSSSRIITLFFQDEDPALGSHRMPYSKDPEGDVLINYQGGGTLGWVRIQAGTEVRLNLLSPFSEQVQVFSAEGAAWVLTPKLSGSDRVSSVAIGGMEAAVARLDELQPGVYRLGLHRGPYSEVSSWLEVHVEGQNRWGQVWKPLLVLVLVLAGLLAISVRIRRRRISGTR